MRDDNVIFIDTVTSKWRRLVDDVIRPVDNDGRVDAAFVNTALRTADVDVAAATVTAADGDQDRGHVRLNLC
jgi:hypothetical protein